MTPENLWIGDIYFKQSFHHNRKGGSTEEFIITAAFIPQTEFGCFWQIAL
jgi:hypothetical protein